MLRQLVIEASLYVNLRQTYVRSGLLSDMRPQKNDLAMRQNVS